MLITLELLAKLLWGELKVGSQCNMLNLMIQHKNAEHNISR